LKQTKIYICVYILDIYRGRNDLSFVEEYIDSDEEAPENAADDDDDDDLTNGNTHYSSDEEEVYTFYFYFILPYFIYTYN
jgi:hypothetical protein